jgi:hypothetical protein
MSEGVENVEEKETVEVEKIEEKKQVIVGDDVCVAMDAEMFKDLFDLMTALIMTEVQVQIRDDGLCLRQMEEAHIALTDMFVPKGYFRELKAGKIISELRLDIGAVKSILSRLSHGDIIEFTVKQGKLHIEVIGKREREFNLPLLMTETLERRTPKMVLNVRIKTGMEGLLYGLEDASKLIIKGEGKKKKDMFGQVTLTTEPMGLKIVAASDDDLYSIGATLTSGWDIMQFEGGVGQHVTLTVACLIAVIRAIAKVTNVVQLEFSTDMPVHIVAELPFKGITLEFWLAPRVQVKEYSSEGGESKVES